MSARPISSELFHGAADEKFNMVETVAEDSELKLAQFNRLIKELLAGTMNRNTFRPWEIEILLDIETCDMKDLSRREMLRRYQKAAQRQMERGMTSSLLKLSEYLEAQRIRRASLRAVEPVGT